MISIKKITYRLLFLCMVLSPSIAFSQSHTINNQSLVNKLADQMAIRNQLQEVPDDIKAQFKQNPLQISAKENKHMLNLFDKAYDSILLLNDFKKALGEKISGPYQNEISRWLDQKNTRIITNADKEFYTLQGKRKRVITMYEMDQKPPSKNYIQLIASLADTTSAAQNTVTSSIIILRSVIKALDHLSEKRNFSDVQINSIVNNFKNQMQEQAYQQVKDEFTIRYYNIDSPILNNYIHFMQSDAGQQLDRSISQSMQAAYEAAADRFLQSINIKN